MSKTLNVRFQQRIDTAANWTEVNPTLLAGEIGIESDTKKFKFGDGTTLWENLPYAGIDQTQLNAIEDNYHLVDVTNEDVVSTDNEALATISNPTKGDIAVVKRAIGGNATSMTAYMYDPKLEGDVKWAALDGNYSAANIFTSSKITLAGDYGTYQDSRKDTVKITQIGNKKIGDTIEAGTSLQSILMDILSQRLQPTITTNPSISVTLNQAGAKEVGTEVTPSYSVSSNDGAYTYEDTTGVSFSDWKITTVGRNTVHQGSELAAESSTSTSGSFTKFTVGEDTNYKLNVTAKGTAGNVAKDNLGDPSDPTIQIAEKDNYSNNSSAITGYRAWFYGYKKGTDTQLDVANLTSANIRALTSANGSIPATINATEMQQMFFAIPKGKKTKVAVEGTNPVAPQTVTGPITVSVEGANGYTATDYDVWYISNATAAKGSQDYKITVS